MTNKDIKKGAACCLDCSCYQCPYKNKANCEELVKNDLFNLLDSYENEIERLKAQVVVLQGWAGNEKVKEFVKRFKEKAEITEIVYSGALVRTDYTISSKDFNNLLKEMGVK